MSASPAPRPPIKSFKVLENDVVRLEIFDPTTHAAPLISTSAAHPDLYKYLPSAPRVSYEAVARFEQTMREDEKAVLYAIVDKVIETGSMAGYVALINTQYAHLSSEIGIFIFPQYHRTHITSNATGLLLHHCLDPPALNGLGLRRVVWSTHADNAASISAAQRLGFTLEGTMRWTRVLKSGKAGVQVGERERGELVDEGCPGRHTVLLSMCWDDWLVDGKREFVRERMKKRGSGV